MSERFSQYALRTVATIIVLVVAVGTAVYLQNSRPPSTATYNIPNTNSGPATPASSVIDNNQNAANATTPTQVPPATSSAIKSSPFDIITLTSPASDATIGSGTNISGEASGLTSVLYRIEDSSGTVITSGPLVVVNGIFYGTIQSLATSSKTGSFEIFDKKASNGAEENDIKIPVSFQ